MNDSAIVGGRTTWPAGYFRTFTRPSGNMLADALEGKPGMLSGSTPAAFGVETLQGWAGLTPAAAPADAGAASVVGNAAAASDPSVFSAEYWSRVGKLLAWALVGLVLVAVGVLTLTRG